MSDQKLSLVTNIG